VFHWLQDSRKPKFFVCWVTSSGNCTFTGLISGMPTASGNNTVTITVTVKDTTGATGTVSFAWNISGGGTCHVTYTKKSEWPGGFTRQRP
jgi:hypothetical protein